MSIVDHISPVQFDNTNGCFSIPMLCRCAEGFVTKAEPTEQAACSDRTKGESHMARPFFRLKSVTENSSVKRPNILGRFAVICPLRRVTINVYFFDNTF